MTICHGMTYKMNNVHNNLLCPSGIVLQLEEVMEGIFEVVFSGQLLSMCTFRFII